MEHQRIAALRRYEILDTPAEPLFDALVELAAQTFDAPTALISLVDVNRQWFKACVGLDASETPRDVAFCDHVIRSDEVMVVADATADPRFSDNPLVTGELGIRFYAGAPLITAEGERLGTLCIIDYAPRPDFGEAQARKLQALAASVMQGLTLRRDALESRRIAQVASDRQRLLDLAEEVAGVGAWSRDAANGDMIFSPQVHRILGFDPSEPPPTFEAALRRFHPDDAQALAARMAAALSYGEGFEIQARVVRPDGTTRRIVTRGACRVSEAGATEAVFGAFVDVTELKLADEALRKSEARTRVLVDNSTDLMVRTAAQGVILDVSRACEAYGYQPSDLIGRNTLALIHPDDVEAVIAAQKENFRPEGPSSGPRREFRVRRADGEYVWLQGNPTVLRDASGAPVEVINIYRDISARKAMEAELAAARDAALAGAAVKSAFLANMSHEIRTPLTAILGFTRLLEAREDLDEAARQHVRRVSSASQALMTLVNDVLDFSKLEAGQVEICPRPSDPAEALRDALFLFAPQADEKGLSLAYAGEELPECVEIDPDRLRQILLNLIGNAVKFTEAGQVRLSARHRGGRLEIAVTDTGPGMTEAQQAELFQRFSQVDASSTRKHGGTGLGLAICKGLAEAMGGEIGVRSKPGDGSVFYFAVAAPLAEAGNRIDAAAEASVLDGVRVLVIDDNRMNRDLARAVLEQLGAEVTEAADGPAGVEEAERLAFDVILMDVRMPGLDGAGALARIRAGQGPNRGTPILAFTADTDLNQLEAGHGFDGVVAKPISPTELAQTLMAALEPGRTADSAAA